MALTFHPKPGLILVADFSHGFKEPEMVKSGRPVVVLAQGRGDLVTVAALSTVEPAPVLQCHYLLPMASLPQHGNFQVRPTWVKGDMIYTLGFHRLNLIQLGKRDPQTGKRVYYKNRLGREQMNQIYTCVLHGLNLGALGQHLPP